MVRDRVSLLSVMLITALLLVGVVPHGEAAAQVDPAAVGTWELRVPNPQGVARWVWEIQANGTYSFHSSGPGAAPAHAGVFEAVGGTWTLRSTTMAWADGGTYSMPSPETFVLTGRLGTGAWQRSIAGRTSPSGSARTSPAAPQAEPPPSDAKSPANIHFNRGSEHYKNSQYHQAIDLNPDEVEAYNKRGLANADSGQNDQAILDYTKAIELDPNVARVYYNRGFAYANKSQYDQAILDFTKAIDLDPSDAATYHNRGFVYAKTGQYDQAISDYTKAIELKPNYAAAYNNQAAAYTEKGQAARASSDYAKARELSARAKRD